MNATTPTGVANDNKQLLRGIGIILTSSVTGQYNANGT